MSHENKCKRAFQSVCRMFISRSWKKKQAKEWGVTLELRANKSLHLCVEFACRLRVRLDLFS